MIGLFLSGGYTFSTFSYSSLTLNGSWPIIVIKQQWLLNGLCDSFVLASSLASLPPSVCLLPTYTLPVAPDS